MAWDSGRHAHRHTRENVLAPAWQRGGEALQAASRGAEGNLGTGQQVMGLAVEGRERLSPSSSAHESILNAQDVQVGRLLARDPSVGLQSGVGVVC